METATKKLSHAVWILERLAVAPMRFSEIQRELWTRSHGRPPVNEAEYRGWWCHALLGGRDPGLLKFYTVQTPDGLWHRNNTDHKGKPWKTMFAALGYVNKKGTILIEIPSGGHCT